MDLNKKNGQRPPAVPPQHPGQGDENTVVYGGPQGSGGGDENTVVYGGPKGSGGDDENTMVYGGPKPSGGDENTVVMGGPQGSGGRATPPPQIPNPGQGPWTPAPAPKNNKTLIKVIVGVGAAIITTIIVAVVVFLCLVNWDDDKKSHREESQDTAVAVEEVNEIPAPAAEAPAAPAKPYYPTHGTLTFTGKVDGKYKVSMTINTENRSGTYYYTKYGPKNKMTLYITSFSGSGDGPYYINMDEYNPDGEYCGEWRGTLKDGVYKGDGTYNGRYMPFKLQQKAK